MKQLIRRLSRVGHASNYIELCPESPRATRRVTQPTRCVSGRKMQSRKVPVYVGEEMERFVVPAELLNDPVFIGLLDLSAQEYGFDQEGVIRIPCHVIDFRRLLDSLGQSRDLRGSFPRQSCCYYWL